MVSPKLSPNIAMYKFQYWANHVGKDMGPKSEVLLQTCKNTLGISRTSWGNSLGTWFLKKEWELCENTLGTNQNKVLFNASCNSSLGDQNFYSQIDSSPSYLFIYYLFFHDLLLTLGNCAGMNSGDMVFHDWCKLLLLCTR